MYESRLNFFGTGGTDSPEAVAALRAVHLTEQVETDGAVGTEDHRGHIQEWAFTYMPANAYHIRSVRVRVAEGSSTVCSSGSDRG